jgi:hypothetical protein
MTKNDISGTIKLVRDQGYQWRWYSKEDKEWNVEHWIYTKEVIDAVKDTDQVLFGRHGNRRLDLYDGELIIQNDSGGWHWLDTEEMDYDY